MSPTTATDTTAARSTAQRWYCQQLAADPDARAYLAGRGIGRDLALRLGIGYAPRSWTGLTEHLRGAGFPDQVSVEAGLVLRTARRTTVDRFRGRIMLPVRDGTTGRLVGFTGRATPAAAPDSPRYLDSPTSADYAKGAHVHGLWEGRRRLELGAVPVLTEGAFDAHAVTLAGQGRYVGIAPSGTALTGDQVRALDRVAPLAGRRVVVAFDPDGPGQQAALAAFPLLAARGALVDAAVLPAGLDPADLARAAGPDQLRDCLDTAQPLEDRAVTAQLERWPERGRWAHETVGALRDAARIVAVLHPDRVGRQVALIAARLDVPPAEVTAAVVDAVAPEPQPPPPVRYSETVALSRSTAATVSEVSGPGWLCAGTEEPGPASLMDPASGRREPRRVRPIHYDHRGVGW